MQQQLITGFRAFITMWIGQSISLIGTSMTRFALTIWAYEQTGSATALALVGFFSFAPMVILSPVAGALADRWNRKLVMIVSDLVAGLMTIAVLLLFVSGSLQIWHLFITGFIASAFEAFQFPALSASITMMVDKKHYTRVSGMQEIAQSGSTIAAPILAGVVLAFGGIQTVLLIDVVSFLFAVGSLLLVYIPQPKQTDIGKKSRGSLWQESLYGFRYILARPSLLGVQLVFFFVNLFGVFGMILLAPMILAATNNNELILGSVQSVLGIGGVVGGIVISAWGGPKRRIHGVLIGMALSGIFGQMVIGLGQSIVIWSVGAFFTSCFIPLINGSNQAIWQVKVPPDVQGRVFSVRRLIAQITGPLGMLLAGPLADGIFEPAMMPGGALAPVFGGLVGTGPGAGMALLFVFSGFLLALSGVAGFAFPIIRNVEDILPDYEAVAEEPVPEDLVVGELGEATAPAT